MTELLPVFNVENVSYGLGLCGVCCGLCPAFGRGRSARCAGVGPDDPADADVAGVGNCCSNTVGRVIIDHPAGPRPLRELLPDAFGPDDLTRR